MSMWVKPVRRCDDQYREKHLDLIGAAPYLKQLKSHNSIVGLLNLGGGGAGYSSHMSMWAKPARRCDDQYHRSLLDRIESPKRTYDYFFVLSCFFINYFLMLYFV